MASRWSHPYYLLASDVDNEEIRDIHILCSNPSFVGPFASTYLENSNAWRKYVYGLMPEHMERFERAAERHYWKKYVGLFEYDPVLMSQIVHSISILGSGQFGELPRMIVPSSPGTYIPSYKQSLLTARKDATVLVVGALSPYSVADLWAFKKYLLPDGNIKIVDVNGGLNEDAAKLYKLPFTVGDFLETTDEPIDVILTDHLTTWRTPDLRLARYSDLIQRRGMIFEACYKQLKKNGRLALIEKPLLDEEVAARHDQKGSLFDADRRLIMKQLTAAGFHDISVTLAPSFVSRNAVNRFLFSGRCSKAETCIKTGDMLAYRIEAKK